MSFRASPFLRTAPARALRVSNVPRTFSTAPQLRLKEDKERSPEQAEAAKQSQLKKQKEGKGHWHEELASNSEANVKADQDATRVGNHAQHMEELKQVGKEKSEKGELSQ